MFEEPEEKTPAQRIADGAKYLQRVGHPKGPGKFGPELLYQTVLTGLESLLHGRLDLAGAMPSSHNALGLAREYQQLVEVDPELAAELVAFASYHNTHGDQAFPEGGFPLTVDQVREAARKFLERLG
nr:hypothetical protein [uncultured Holophaga sp.]